MKTQLLVLVLTLCPLLAGQDSTDLSDKAPPPIDEALRARVAQFYQAQMEGKFREAFTLVADDSQDAFFTAPKQQYKGCETIRINYSEEFTKAQVVESCEGELAFHGHMFHSKVPVTTNWKVEKGQWYWYYVKPKFIPSPFSPTGLVPAPDEADVKAGRTAPVLPDPAVAARTILSLVKLDKTVISLSRDQTSKDELHVRNQMKGAVSLSTDPVTLPGLKITFGKTELQANEETTVGFEYHSDDKKARPSPITVQLHIQPTGQVFPIEVAFSNPDQQDKR
jgi:hypothetical protein